MATGSGIDFVTQVSIAMIHVLHYFICSLEIQIDVVIAFHLLYFYYDYQDYPCVVVVGLGKKNVDSDTEMKEEDQKSGNLRQASGGKALVVFMHCK